VIVNIVVVQFRIAIMLGVFIYRRFLSTSLFELASLSTRLHAATRQRIVVVVADSQIFCDAGFH
jgi:hypothetical protein